MAPCHSDTPENKNEIPSAKSGGSRTMALTLTKATALVALLARTQIAQADENEVAFPNSPYPRHARGV